jgi:hypothetical protein
MGLKHTFPLLNLLALGSVPLSWHAHTVYRNRRGGISKHRKGKPNRENNTERSS